MSEEKIYRVFVFNKVIDNDFCDDGGCSEVLIDYSDLVAYKDLTKIQFDNL